MKKLPNSTQVTKQEISEEEENRNKAFFTALKQNPVAFDIYKKLTAENDTNFIAIKSAVFETLLEKKTTGEKYEFLSAMVAQLTNSKLEYDLNIHKEWTAEQKMNWTPKKLPVYENLFSFLNEQLEIYSKLLKLEGGAEIITDKSFKLNWNGQSNVLIHVFYELKKAKGKANKPLLINTNDEIAVFLKENFTCFEKTKLNTIVSQLKKKEPSKKSDTKIEIWL